MNLGELKNKIDEFYDRYGADMDVMIDLNFDPKVDDTIEEVCRRTGDAEEFKTTPKKSKFEDNMYTFRSTNLTSEQVRLPKELLGLRKDLLEYNIRKSIKRD